MSAACPNKTWMKTAIPSNPSSYSIWEVMNAGTDRGLDKVVNANGADTALEDGCDHDKGQKEIFLPWKGFNQNDSSLFVVDDRALALANEIHPTYNKLSRTAKLFVGRNMHQVLGKTLTKPVACVVCWTKHGCE